jgi:hypothetical protein
MDVEQRMSEAGLPADNLVSRRATLPGPVQELHRWALQTVADTGQPPADGDLEERARALGLDLHDALAARWPARSSCSSTRRWAGFSAACRSPRG